MSGNPGVTRKHAYQADLLPYMRRTRPRRPQWQNSERVEASNHPSTQQAARRCLVAVAESTDGDGLAAAPTMRWHRAEGRCALRNELVARGVDEQMTKLQESKDAALTK